MFPLWLLVFFTIISNGLKPSTSWCPLLPKKRLHLSPYSPQAIYMQIKKYGRIYLCLSWGITIWWAWARLNLFRNILLTHGIEYYMTWRNVLVCVQRWKIKMDEKCK
jgi:hypothetical protein